LRWAVRPFTPVLALSWALPLSSSCTSRVERHDGTPNTIGPSTIGPSKISYSAPRPPPEESSGQSIRRLAASGDCGLAQGTETKSCRRGTVPLARRTTKPSQTNTLPRKARRASTSLTPARHAGEKKPIDLYYWPTPNGWKITIMLEECALPYTVIPVDISKGDQFKP